MITLSDIPITECRWEGCICNSSAVPAHFLEAFVAAMNDKSLLKKLESPGYNCKTCGAPGYSCDGLRVFHGSLEEDRHCAMLHVME